MSSKQSQFKKVALAYSGGLDTSIIMPWLKENYGCQVVAVCGDIGQGGDELTGLKAKAKKTGASEVYVEDMREEFVQDYLWPMVRSGAVYEHKYLLGTSIARPLLAKKQVEVALATGCDALAHGCTGKGNDQVRFELTYKALAPHLPVIAPWREWDIISREDAIEYAKSRNVPIAQSTTKIYSRDRNIWHISHEGGELEDPANAPTDGIWMLTTHPWEAPDKPETVTIAFESGIPVSVNGKTLSGVKLLETLNKIGGKHGVGRIDLVENRFVGMKSRGVYETPGGTILLAAHRAIESITLDRGAAHLKDELMPRYAELIYYGFWFSPEREMLQALIDKSQEHVEGEVTLKLYKGNVMVIGRESDKSLYSDTLVTFEDDQGAYDQKDAAGFIKLNALRLRTLAARKRRG